MVQDNEVFSTDWPFGGGQDQSCGDDGADPLRTQADAAQRFPPGLEQGDAAFSFGAQPGQQSVAVLGARWAPLAGVWMPMPAPW